MSIRIAIFVFYLGFGCLFSHELDATIQNEWRLLYVLRSMPDETAMTIFAGLHIPLFALIVEQLYQSVPMGLLGFIIDSSIHLMNV